MTHRKIISRLAYFFAMLLLAIVTNLFAETGVERVEVAFADDSRPNRILLEADIHGKRGLFLVDTGAQFSSIRLDRLSHFGLVGQLTFPMRVRGANSVKTYQAQALMIESLQLNTVDFGRASFIALDFSSFAGSTVDGVIGQDFLSQHQAEMRMATQVISFAHPNSVQTNVNSIADAIIGKWTGIYNNGPLDIIFDGNTLYTSGAVTSRVAYSLDGNTVQYNFANGAQQRRVEILDERRLSLTNPVNNQTIVYTKAALNILAESKLDNNEALTAVGQGDNCWCDLPFSERVKGFWIGNYFGAEVTINLDGEFTNPGGAVGGNGRYALDGNRINYSFSGQQRVSIISFETQEKMVWRNLRNGAVVAIYYRDRAMLPSSEKIGEAMQGQWRSKDGTLQLSLDESSFHLISDSGSEIQTDYKLQGKLLTIKSFGTSTTYAINFHSGDEMTLTVPFTSDELRFEKKLGEK